MFKYICFILMLNSPSIFAAAEDDFRFESLKKDDSQLEIYEDEWWVVAPAAENNSSEEKNCSVKKITQEEIKKIEQYLEYFELPHNPRSFGSIPYYGDSSLLDPNDISYFKMNAFEFIKSDFKRCIYHISFEKRKEIAGRIAKLEEKFQNFLTEHSAKIDHSIKDLDFKQF